MPSNGCMVNFLGTMLQNHDGDGYICDKLVVGKPNPNIVDIIRKEHDIPRSELDKFVMIGDNPKTDIAFGNNAGIDTCLVLTGVVKSPEESLEFSTCDDLLRPTHIMNSMGDKWA